MAREYPRTGGGSSPACHRRSDVSRAAELTPWSSARDRSVDDLDLVLLHPFDPRSCDLDKLEVESRLLAGPERRLRGRCGGRAQKLALGVKSLSGELDPSQSDIGDVLHRTHDVEMARGTDIHSGLHPGLTVGALDLDFDLLLKVGGEGSREAAEYHEPRDQPCHARPHAYPPSFLVYCVSQIESRRASPSRPVTLALTPILRRTSVQMAHRRRVSTSLPRRCPVDGNGHASPAQIRARLTHPVIDADGHWLEYGPVVSEQLRRIGGDRAAEGFLSVGRHVRESLSMSVAERRRRRISQEAFWSSPEKNTRDRATAMLPRLLYERLDELALDFAVLYPTVRRRSAVGAVHVARHRTTVPHRLTPADRPPVAKELHLQPHRPLLHGWRRRVQGTVPRRSDARLSLSQVGLPRGRRGVGLHPV